MCEKQSTAVASRIRNRRVPTTDGNAWRTFGRFDVKTSRLATSQSNIYLACRLHIGAARAISRLGPLLPMHLRLSILLVAGSSIVPALIAQEKTLQLPVTELVAKNIEAKGGTDALRAVQSLRFTGKMLVNQGKLEFAYVQTKKRPGDVRSEATLQGMTLVQAYDGTQGWKVAPFQGRKDPEKISADDAKGLVEDAEIAGPLVDWKENGSTVEYLGTEDVEGTMAHKLKVVRKNGDVNYVYLDPDHFLEIRIVSQRIEKGVQVETETDLGDYEKIGGVFFPFSIDAGAKGSTDKQKIILEKGEANVPMDDSVFHFPATPAK